MARDSIKYSNKLQFTQNIKSCWRVQKQQQTQLTHEFVSLIFKKHMYTKYQTNPTCYFNCSIIQNPYVHTHRRGNFIICMCILYYIEFACWRDKAGVQDTYSSLLATYKYLYIKKTSILTTSVYIIEYNSTLNLIVYMTKCFSVTHYLNITKVPFLLTVNTYIPF
jgi:hypothetical protein